MKHIYFDQNITKKLCNNSEFLDNFLRQQFKSSYKLIITPLSLIELSGAKIKDCLKEDSEYQLDVSDLISHQMAEGLKFYQNNVCGDIINFLQMKLKNQKQYVQTQQGNYIFMVYLEYLNSIKGITEIPDSITYDRVFALPLEQFKNKNAHFDIFQLTIQILAKNPHTPCLRLFLKSGRKLPPPQDEKANAVRKNVIDLISKIDVKEKGDLVDTEMIQLAIMGYGGEPVHFYTKDNVQKIKDRIYIAYFFLHEIIQKAKHQVESKNKKPILMSTEQRGFELCKKVSKYKFSLGTVSIIDDSGFTVPDQKLSIKDLIPTFGI